jgi:hypothetical protein
VDKDGMHLLHRIETATAHRWIKKQVIVTIFIEKYNADIDTHLARAK